MADTPRDIIVLGFRQTLRTAIKRADRKADGTPGEVIDTKENEPEYWVKYSNRAMPTAVTESRLRMMDPDNIKLAEGADGGEKMAFFQHRWAQIKPPFDAWMAGQAMPEYGIPLVAWPALSPEQVKAFQSAGIKSVEDVRDMSEKIMQAVRLPNLRDLKKMAEMYLANLDTSEAAKKQEHMQSEIDGLKEQLGAAMSLLEEQAKANAETEGGKKPARKAA